MGYLIDCNKVGFAVGSGVKPGDSISDTKRGGTSSRAAVGDPGDPKPVQRKLKFEGEGADVDIGNQTVPPM